MEKPDTGRWDVNGNVEGRAPQQDPYMKPDVATNRGM